MTVSRLLARPLLASTFVSGPLNALKDPQAHARKAQPVTDRVVPVVEKAGARVGVPVPHDPMLWVRINAGVQLAAAFGLATGRAPRLSSAVLAGSLVPTTLAGHPFWQETDPGAKRAQRIHFFKNLSLLGGLLIAAGDTDGKPGVAWRARRAAADARRAARQEARLLKAKAHLG
jgi:uncharacterized membrane protein YphA (DoxX/SURF4 family)